MQDMIEYIGIKSLKAKLMTRGAYNEYRGWELPADENGDDAGYLVEYTESLTSNHPDHAGYISWSPILEFGAAYQPVECMGFSAALHALQNGARVSRGAWCQDGSAFLFLVGGSSFTVNREPLLSILGEGETVVYKPHIDIKQPDGTIGVWAAGSIDMLADDWYIVPNGIAVGLTVADEEAAANK